MPTDSTQYQNYLNTLPSNLMDSEETQEMALEFYYTSVNNVLQAMLPIQEIMQLLEKTKDAGGSMRLLRDRIEDFDAKVYAEFTKLIETNIGGLNY